MDKEIGNLTRLQKMKKGLIKWNGGELMLSVVLRNLDIYLCPSTYHHNDCFWEFLSKKYLR